MRFMVMVKATKDSEAGVKPGQFQDFDLSLGVLPKSGRLQFTALQTYSDGEQVKWNEISTDPSVEPESTTTTSSANATLARQCSS